MQYRVHPSAGIAAILAAGMIVGAGTTTAQQVAPTDPAATLSPSSRQPAAAAPTSANVPATTKPPADGGSTTPQGAPAAPSASGQPAAAAPMPVDARATIRPPAGVTNSSTPQIAPTDPVTTPAPSNPPPATAPAATSPQVAAAPPAATPAEIRTAILRVDTPGLPPASRLDLPPPDLGLAGAELATRDNATTGAFLGQRFTLATATASPQQALAQLAQLIAGGASFIVVMADEATTLTLADAARAQAGEGVMILNALAEGDGLRGADCRANVIHVAASRAMKADALAQFLMWKRWDKWLLIEGSHPQDKALGEAYARAATKFGAKLVETREFADTGGARQTDTGYVQIQQQMPVFTQRAPAHDVLIAADEAGTFAPYLPYQTWDARPVAGSAGLSPVTWHPAAEAWGGAQLQSRFEALAHRPMREADYQAWLALRLVGEAASRADGSDAAALRRRILDPRFEVGGFKGQKLTIRDWDHQLRQPVLLATPAIVASVSPQDQYLHQTSALDTLGIDRPESSCTLK